jgi:AhpD family alkylhydroperoxidase
MSKNYPEYLAANLAASKALYAEIPETIKAFGGLTRAAQTDGALDKKTKEFIALGIAVALRCDGCIGYHVQNLIKLGATRAEISETLGVVVQMQGGPGVVYAADALLAFDQLSLSV